MITEISDVSTEIEHGNVILDFYTDSCRPCKTVGGILEEISEEFDHVRVLKVDVERNPDVSQKFGVMSVPTIIFMKDNRVKKTLLGCTNKKALISMIKKFRGE